MKLIPLWLLCKGFVSIKMRSEKTYLRIWLIGFDLEDALALEAAPSTKAAFYCGLSHWLALIMQVNRQIRWNLQNDFFLIARGMWAENASQMLSIFTGLRA